MHSNEPTYGLWSLVVTNSALFILDSHSGRVCWPRCFLCVQQ